MNGPEESEICVRVDPTNPGQFFACCGLLEVADRLWGGAEGWFDAGSFRIRSSGRGSLPGLLRLFRAAPLLDDRSGGGGEDSEGDDDSDDGNGAQPLEIALPDLSRPMRLDWWSEKSLKPWAGSMKVRLIYRAMTSAIDEACADPFNDGRVVFDPGSDADGRTSIKTKKPTKREPFYFDARRGASARSLDAGFAPDAIQRMRTVAYPAVESLCLVGLQRFRPAPADARRVFEYHTWASPLDAMVGPAAVCGFLPDVGSRAFRFSNAFRTDQRKHKAFSPATPIEGRHRD